METKIVIALDLFVPNEVLRFDLQFKSPKDAMPRIGAISIVAQEPELPREMEVLDKACVTEADPLIFDNKSLEGYKLWLLLAHEPWQQDSVLVRHSKLWKCLPSELSLEGMLLHPELMTQSSAGVRYFGVAEVTRKEFFNATQILRYTRAAAIILSRTNWGESKTDITRLFDYAFPKKGGDPQNSVDWLNLAIGCCPSGDIVIRVSGSWDEREASIDFIMLNELLPLFDASSGVSGKT